MIVDLRVDGRTAVVIGAGAEALKRIEALLAGGCAVHVVAADDHEVRKGLMLAMTRWGKYAGR